MISKYNTFCKFEMSYLSTDEAIVHKKHKKHKKHKHKKKHPAEEDSGGEINVTDELEGDMKPAIKLKIKIGGQAVEEAR